MPFGAARRYNPRVMSVPPKLNTLTDHDILASERRGR
jgi:hypothetical protein